MSYFRSINQAVTESSTNTSVTNLAPYLGGDATGLDTFIGTAVSTLGVNAIQVGLKTDKNCTVWVEQSNDATNWDLSDSFNYYTGLNNFGNTTQAISSFARTRVRNLSDTSTSYFRLSTVLCPIVEALPRSLSYSGNLRVAIKENTDVYGFEAENTPMGDMRVVEPYRLSGATFTGSLDNNYWVDTTGTGGTVAVSGAQCILGTGTNLSNTVALQSVSVARYVGGASNRFRSVIRIPDSGVVGNTRKWGIYDGTNGAYFQLSDTTVGIATLRDSTVSLITSGSFNGDYGNIKSYVDLTVHTYEIYYTNSKVFYSFDGRLLHTVTASSNTWTSTMHLPLRYESKNTGISTNVLMNIRAGTIYSLGREVTAPKYKYIVGNNNTTVCKAGPGKLHRLIVNDGAGGSFINIYDNPTGSGTTINILNTATVSSPISIEFMVPFYLGLTITVTNTVNFTVIYE
jgi:hypothetical protein